MSICFSQAPLPSRPEAMSRAMAAAIASAPLAAGFLGLAILSHRKIGSHFGSNIATLEAMKLGPYDTGRTAVYAARRDPRFSYCLYVPTGYRSGNVRPGLLVVVHGSPRTFMEFRDRFQDFGEDCNTLIL